jgi:hypothetical protein
LGIQLNLLKYEILEKFGHFLFLILLDIKICS